MHYSQVVDKHGKVSLVERVIRTIRQLVGKYMSRTKGSKYIHVLDDLVFNYNNSRHGAIGTNPDWAFQHRDVFPRITKDDKKKLEVLQKTGKMPETQRYLQIGDIVRVHIKHKNAQAFGVKSHAPTWSKELYMIESVNRKRYVLQYFDNFDKKLHEKGDQLAGTYSYAQLLKVDIPHSKIAPEPDKNNDSDPDAHESEPDSNNDKKADVTVVSSHKEEATPEPLPHSLPSKSSEPSSSSAAPPPAQSSAPSALHHSAQSSDPSVLPTVADIERIIEHETDSENESENAPNVAEPPPPSYKPAPFELLIPDIPDLPDLSTIMPHLAARQQKKDNSKEPSLKSAFHIDNKPKKPLHQRFLAPRDRSPTPQLHLPIIQPESEPDDDNDANDDNNEEESSSSNPSYEENQRRIRLGKVKKRIKNQIGDNTRQTYKKVDGKKVSTRYKNPNFDPYQIPKH